MIFDDRANWRAHWGSDQKTLLKIHQMTILPTIRYGEAAYGSATKATLKRLDPVHHKGVGLSLGTFAICRVENLLCEAGLPTLTEMRDRDTAKTAVRILTNTDHPTRHSYTSRTYDQYATKLGTLKPMCVRAMEYLGQFGIDSRKIEATPAYLRSPWKETDEDRLDTTLAGFPKGAGSERYRREATRIIAEKYEGHQKIYTDGSKRDDKAGYAVSTPNCTYRRRVYQQNTVFSTEQEAITKAISVTESTKGDKVISTDSLSTLTAIRGSNHTKNPKTIKLREMMDRLKKHITLLWVPGHMGIPGNEKADDEAKAALDDDLLQNEEYPPQDLQNWIKAETSKNIKER
jgi:ribonuclease HI